MISTIADALARKGYETLTPVQQAVSDTELTGRDLLVSAQTGSGKTIAFGLAIAPTLLGDDTKFDRAGAPLALVVAPTRELAIQVKRELSWLYADAGAQLASCVGGMDMRDERRALARGAHIVVATPGRLRDHIMRGSIDLSAVRAVVLDEADEMLDLGFREDLEFILGETPETRQTLLFSATVPNAIAKLAQSYQTNAERISTVGEQKQHADIEYRAMLVAARDGENAVINTLRYYDAPNAIVFCNTRATVSRMTTRLSNRGFPVVALSGELTQSERSNALQAMRDGRAKVCVATDVAARGIDLPKLDLVVHAELPGSHETLLHRSGRTGRAGRKGVSALIVVPSARKKAERILKFAKLTAEWGGGPSAADVNERDQVRMLTSDDWQAEVTESERASVDALIEKFTPDQIAAAYLRQYKTRNAAPEDLMAVDTKSAPKKREAFGPSVWFSLSEGRNQNASPRHLLPMICKAGNVTKDDIGAIRLADDLSYVEIKQASVAGFVAAIGPAMKIEGTKDIVQLDKPPNLPDRSPSDGKRGPKPRHGGGKREGGPRDWKDKPDQNRGKPRSEGGYKSRPAGDNDGAGKKPWKEKSDKPFSKPKSDGSDKPRFERPKRDSAPVDWNDAPEPRRRKPKPEDRKPRKPSAPKPAQADPAVHAPFEGGKRKAAGTKPGTFGKKPKGEGATKKRLTATKGAPPKGKASSKKNRARDAAKKASRGGDATPRRG